MRSELSKNAGLETLESAANFFLCRVDVAKIGFSAGQLRRYLRRLGVLVRYFEKPQFMSDFIRISSGRRADSEQFLYRLGLIFATPLLKTPEISSMAVSCILFDMDGVIADESTSYRAAMVLTAKSYGSSDFALL